MPRLTLWRLLLSNLARRRFRTAALAFMVAVVCGGVALLSCLLDGMSRSVEVGTARFGADLVVLPRGGRAAAEGAMIVGRPTQLTMDGSVLEAVRRLDGVAAASPQVFVKTLTDARCCPGEFFLVGYDPRTDFTLEPWLRGRRTRVGPFDAVVGHRVSLRLGQEVTFYGTPFRIAGQLDRTGVGIDSTVFLPLDGLREMVRFSPERAEEPLRIDADQISVVLVKAADGVRPTAVAEAVTNAVDGIEVALAPQVIASAQRDLGRVLRLLAAAGLLLWLVLLPALALAFSMSVHERRREIGVWRALGAPSRFVFRAVLAEAAVVGGIGAVLGLVPALTAVAVFGGLLAESLGTPYLTPPTGWLAGLAAGLLAAGIATGCGAAVLPARAAAALDPYACIRQGEV